MVLACSIAVAMGSPTDTYACTSGGAMNVATVDGRPIIWQNMDWGDHKVILRKYEGSGGKHDVLEIVKFGSYAWNGLNSQGLAQVINRLSVLGGTGSLGTVSMKIQRECASIADVRSYLKTRGVQDIGQNFLVMDKTGKVATFEIGPSDFWEYDPTNTMRQQQPYYQIPKLFVVRSNKPFTNKSHQELESVVNSWAADNTRFRYETARSLFTQKITNGDKLTVEEVIGIARYGNPGHDAKSVSRPTIGSTTYSIWGPVIHGVKSGEDPKHATMLVALGLPDYSIFIPAWVDLSQAELGDNVKTWDASNIAWWSYKLYEDRFDGAADYDNYINGILAKVEDNIIDAVKKARQSWLANGNTSRFHQEARCRTPCCRTPVCYPRLVRCRTSCCRTSASGRMGRTSSRMVLARPPRRASWVAASFPAGETGPRLRGW